MTHLTSEDRDYYTSHTTPDLRTLRDHLATEVRTTTQTADAIGLTKKGQPRKNLTEAQSATYTEARESQDRFAEHLEYVQELIIRRDNEDDALAADQAAEMDAPLHQEAQTTMTEPNPTVTSLEAIEAEAAALAAWEASQTSDLDADSEPETENLDSEPETENLQPEPESPAPANDEITPETVGRLDSETLAIVIRACNHQIVNNSEAHTADALVEFQALADAARCEMSRRADESAAPLPDGHCAQCRQPVGDQEAAQTVYLNEEDAYEGANGIFLHDACTDAFSARQPAEMIGQEDNADEAPAPKAPRAPKAPAAERQPNGPALEPGTVLPRGIPEGYPSCDGCFKPFRLASVPVVTVDGEVWHKLCAQSGPPSSEGPWTSKLVGGSAPRTPAAPSQPRAPRTESAPTQTRDSQAARIAALEATVNAQAAQIATLATQFAALAGSLGLDIDPSLAALVPAPQTDEAPEAPEAPAETSETQDAAPESQEAEDAA